MQRSFQLLVEVPEQQNDSQNRQNGFERSPRAQHPGDVSEIVPVPETVSGKDRAFQECPNATAASAHPMAQWGHAKPETLQESQLETPVCSENSYTPYFSQ